MIASAHILPLVPRMTVWNASAASRTLDLSAPFSATDYAARDRYLAYRDLVVATAIAKVSLKVNEVWGFKPVQPTLEEPVNDALTDEGAGWALEYVKNTSIPADATGVDQALAKRDGMIYATLWRAAAALAANPLSFTPPDAEETDLWALASAVEQGRLPAERDRISPELFSSADRALAWRDNVLASYAVDISEQMASFYDRAARLLVEIDGPPRIFVLESESDDERVFACYPAVDGQRRLVYNRVQFTLYWTATGSGGVGPTHVTDFSSLVVRDLPGLRDVEYYRQLSATLCAADYKEYPVFKTTRPYDYAAELELVQQNYMLLPASGEWADFCLPVLFHPGCHRFGVGFSSTRVLEVSAAENLDGLATDGSSVSLVAGQEANFSLVIPPGQISVRANITTNDTRIGCTLILNGQAVFNGNTNAQPGAATFTPPSQTNSPGGICTLSFVLLSGTASLNYIELTVAGTGPLVSKIRFELLEPDGFTTSLGETEIATVPESLECVVFDRYFESQVIGAKVRVTHISADACGLKLYQLDVRRYDASQFDPLIGGHKADILRLIADRMRSSYARHAPKFSTLFAAGDWSAEAYSSWYGLVGLGQTLDLAFPVAGPGDVGRPALVPSGVELVSGARSRITGGVVAAVPTLRPLQPWMLAFGARAAAPELAPPRISGCALVPPPPAFGFSATLVVPDDPSVHAITRLDGVIMFNGGQEPGFDACTIANCGAAGGHNYYRLQITATIQGQTPSVGLESTYLVTDIATGAQTVQTVVNFVPVENVYGSYKAVIPVYTAPDGTLAQLQSVVLMLAPP